MISYQKMKKQYYENNLINYDFLYATLITIKKQ